MQSNKSALNLASNCVHLECRKIEKRKEYAPYGIAMERSVKYVVAGHVARTRANYATKNCGQLRVTTTNKQNIATGEEFSLFGYTITAAVIGCPMLTNLFFFQFLHVVCYFSVKSIHCFSFISVGLYGWGVIFRPQRIPRSVF
jgi:hypothetical protein